MDKPLQQTWMTVICLPILFSVATASLAKDAETATVFLVPEVKHDTSLPLSAMHTVISKASRQPTIAPIHHLPYGNTVFVPVKDTVAQLVQGGPLNVQGVVSFLGIGIGLGGYTPSVTPPDTTGAPGLTQYVQIVNSSIAIFNKADGSLQFGPVNTNSLWAGFGGVCETTNSGDALVKFDQLANRWVISQFAHNTSGGQAAPPFLQCVAVSTTSDARSAYHRYAFAFSNFNDFGKIGLSPMGYFMSFFMFNRGSFVGPMACALPRDNMLEGLPAAMQCFNPSPQSTSIDLIPADLDGRRLPPPKTPEFYLSLNQRTREVNLWKFFVDFDNPSRSSFEGPIRVSGTAPFNIPCRDQGPRDPDQGQGCIPQPNTAQLLDELGDRFNYRLAYRQFPNYGVLVINHTVTGFSGGAGVRWYQINIPNDGLYTPDLFQQGTFSPDGHSRWMGSIAIDKNKNIAVGYSVSSANVFPSISVTGRAPLDPPGIMRNEILVAAGAGSQTASFRWGDYSTMSIDPVDDCTFWYTTEYLLSTAGEANWSTHISAFKFPNCA